MCDDLDSDEFNNALADLQDDIGVDDGMRASIFFSGRGYEWDRASFLARLNIIAEYVSEETDDDEE